jgi:hypothetical protein
VIRGIVGLFLVHLLGSEFQRRRNGMVSSLVLSTQHVVRMMSTNAPVVGGVGCLLGFPSG